jgi:hypothetical protein
MALFPQPFLGESNLNKPSSWPSVSILAMSDMQASGAAVDEVHNAAVSC